MNLAQVPEHDAVVTPDFETYMNFDYDGPRVYPAAFVVDEAKVAALLARCQPFADAAQADTGVEHIRIHLHHLYDAGHWVDDDGTEIEALSKSAVWHSSLVVMAHAVNLTTWHVDSQSAEVYTRLFEVQQ